MTSTDPQHCDREPAFEWAHPGLHLRFDHGGNHHVRLAYWATGPDGPSVSAPTATVDVSRSGPPPASSQCGDERIDEADEFQP